MKKRTASAVVLTVLMVVALPAVVVGQDEATQAPEGQVWDLIAVVDFEQGVLVSSDVEATLNLEDGVATAHDGCNTFSGSYSLDGEQLGFDELAGTSVECDGDEQAVEDSFIGELGSVVGYAIADDGSLQLLNISGAPILAFESGTVEPDPDVDEVEIGLAQAKAHIRSLRERVDDLKVDELRHQLDAVEAHLNTLTKKHINLKKKHEALKHRVSAQEVRFLDVVTQLVEQGLVEAE